jgi:DNA primase
VSCSDTRQIDLVEFLFSLGYRPTRISLDDYWYLSPLRKEKHASFKVNRKLNRWYDFGIDKGGSIIDFGMLYFNCTIPALLEMLNQNKYPDRNNLNGTPKNSNKSNKKKGRREQNKELNKKLRITGIKPLTSPALIRYLSIRGISHELASLYCQEVSFQIRDKTYYGIGFKNNAGGFELRSKYFKMSSSPKDITFINKNSNELVVFEGFFDFLSYLTICEPNVEYPKNYLVLNTLSFWKRSKRIFEAHNRIHLYLDRDPAGLKHAREIMNNDKRFKDASLLYLGYKDLNDFLMHRNCK